MPGLFAKVIILAFYFTSHIMSKTQPITQTIKSIAAAFLGVQSNKNRERDFKEGKFSHFLVIGIIAVLLFIMSLIAIVSMVIPS